MKELIREFLKEFGMEVYDMPDSQLDLMMDDHRCIMWEGKEYFVPENNSMYSEDDDLILEFLECCYHV